MVSSHDEYRIRETAPLRNGAVSRLFYSISAFFCGASPAATSCRRYTVTRLYTFPEHSETTSKAAGVLIDNSLMSAQTLWGINARL